MRKPKELRNESVILSRDLQGKLRRLKCREVQPIAARGHKSIVSWLALFLGIGLVAGAFRARGGFLMKLALMIFGELLRRDAGDPYEQTP